MTWLEELEEIRRRTEIAKQMGGAENIKRQHDGGKLTVRERIDRLLDRDSFHEYGALAGATRLPSSPKSTIANLRDIDSFQGCRSSDIWGARSRS